MFRMQQKATTPTIHYQKKTQNIKHPKTKHTSLNRLVKSYFSKNKNKLKTEIHYNHINILKIFGVSCITDLAGSIQPGFYCTSHAPFGLS